MNWNYRIMRHSIKVNADKLPFDKKIEPCEWFVIHEVDYNDKREIVSWSKYGDRVTGESIEELKATLSRMLMALGAPVLEYDMEPEGNVENSPGAAIYDPGKDSKDGA